MKKFLQSLAKSRGANLSQRLRQYGAALLFCSLIPVPCSLLSAESGSVTVTGGGEVSFENAASTNWVTSADGKSLDFVITFTNATDAASFTFPGATEARILAVGGGGGGGGGDWDLDIGTLYVGGAKAAISIPDGEVLAISDNFPPKKLRAVQTWIDMRVEDLLANWELAKSGKKPLWVQPLI